MYVPSRAKIGKDIVMQWLITAILVYTYLQPMFKKSILIWSSYDNYLHISD